jgi:putative FmdB family regulatory protein
MPHYDYQCENCRKQFSVYQSISEHGKTVITCPKCHQDKVRQKISTFMVKTSKKS